MSKGDPRQGCCWFLDELIWSLNPESFLLSLLRMVGKSNLLLLHKRDNSTCYSARWFLRKSDLASERVFSKKSTSRSVAVIESSIEINRFGLTRKIQFTVLTNHLSWIFTVLYIYSGIVLLISSSWKLQHVHIYFVMTVFEFFWIFANSSDNNILFANTNNMYFRRVLKSF